MLAGSLQNKDLQRSLEAYRKVQEGVLLQVSPVSMSTVKAKSEDGAKRPEYPPFGRFARLAFDHHLRLRSSSERTLLGFCLQLSSCLPSRHAHLRLAEAFRTHPTLLLDRLFDHQHCFFAKLTKKEGFKTIRA